MKKDHPSREIFDKLVDSPYPAFAFVAGVKLDVFTPLGDGPKTAEELAAVLNVDPRKLSPLLYALVVGRRADLGGRCIREHARVGSLPGERP